MSLSAVRRVRETVGTSMFQGRDTHGVDRERLGPTVPTQSKQSSGMYGHAGTSLRTTPRVHRKFHLPPVHRRHQDSKTDGTAVQPEKTPELPLEGQLLVSTFANGKTQASNPFKKCLHANINNFGAARSLSLTDSVIQSKASAISRKTLCLQSPTRHRMQGLDEAMKALQLKVLGLVLGGPFRRGEFQQRANVANQ